MDDDFRHFRAELAGLLLRLGAEAGGGLVKLGWSSGRIRWTSGPHARGARGVRWTTPRTGVGP
jgi:hypothetical protein